MTTNPPFRVRFLSLPLVACNFTPWWPRHHPTSRPQRPRQHMRQLAARWRSQVPAKCRVWARCWFCRARAPPASSVPSPLRPAAALRTETYLDRNTHQDMLGKAKLGNTLAVERSAGMRKAQLGFNDSLSSHLFFCRVCHHSIKSAQSWQIRPQFDEFKGAAVTRRRRPQ